mgnify:CR=1 FL=1
MKFLCEYCKYDTNHRGSYNKHLVTYKHHKNKKIALYREQGNPPREQGNPSREQKNYICEHCYLVLSTKSNFNRHLNVCKKKIMSDNILYKKKYKESVEKIEKMKEMLYKKDIINSNLQKQIDELTIKNELLVEIKDICKKSNKSVMNVIINNYNEAPNLKPPPIEDMTKKEFQRYINKGVPKGLVELIRDFYVTNIPNEERSLWCIDQSRMKYLIRAEDKWKVDLMGQTFRKTLIPPIRKRVMEMTQEHSNDYHDFMRLADSVMKIDKGRYQNKVMKEISNMFLLGESK